MVKAARNRGVVLETLASVLEPSMRAGEPQRGSGQGREPDCTLEGSPWQKEEGDWKNTQVRAWAAVQARKDGPSGRAVAHGLERRGGDGNNRRWILAA